MRRYHMKLTTFALTLISMLGIALASPASRAEQGQSTTSGVFTEEQAKRGEAAYSTNCSSCHLGQLEGDGFAPALTGPEFMANWSGTTVGDLFERIRISMPPGQESSVSASDKTDIVAFILQVNKFPAGSAELAKDTETLKQIKFELPK